MTDTYSEDEDIEMRLALGDHYGGQVEQIRHVRERAHRWIRHKFAEQGKMDEMPNPSEELPPDFDILQDIEATRAAYFYKRDLMEWTSKQGRTQKKVDRWKKDSKEMLEQLFRRKWGDELYAFSDR